MSLAYDEYLAEHIGNVNKGLNWMLDNLGLKEEKTALEEAMVSFNHDESKYSTEEYNAYDQYFYGGNCSYKVVQDFNYAWLHHIHQNPHHWQYWVLINDDPGEDENGTPHEYPFSNFVALKIPLPYIFEMIADWWSFSWKKGNLFEIFNWYAAHRNYQYIHPESRKIIEAILKKIWDVLIMQETIAGHDISDIEKQYKQFWIEHEDIQPAFGKLEYNPDYEDSYREAADNAAVTAYGNDVEFYGFQDKVEHSGIKGQKWGIRRFQNYDGSLTEAGRERYGRNLVEKKKAYDPSYRQEILSNSKNTKEIMNKAKTLNKDLNDEYKKWINDESAVKKDMATYYKKQGWPEKDIDKDYNEMGIDLHDDVWGEHVRKNPILNNKANKIYELGQEYRKEAEKIYRSLLEAYGDVDANWSSSKEHDGSMLKILTDKAGYDDYYDILYRNDYVEKTDSPKHTRQELTKAIKDMDKELKALKTDKNADPEYIELVKLERDATQEELDLIHSEDEDEDEDLYGVPELKKFPIPDKKHVKSAIRFFNYVNPKYEKELAEAILEKAKEFGLDLESDISVGDENRLKKYLKKEES